MPNFCKSFLVTIPACSLLRLSSWHLLLKNSKISEKKSKLINLAFKTFNKLLLQLTYYSLSHDQKWTTYSFLAVCFSTLVLILFSLLRKLFPPNIFAKSDIYVSKSKMSITSPLKFSISPLLLLEVLSFSSEHTKYAILFINVFYLHNTEYSLRAETLSNSFFLTLYTEKNINKYLLKIIKY